MADDDALIPFNGPRRLSGAQQWQAAIEAQRQRDLTKPSMGEQIGDIINRMIAGNPLMQAARLYQDIYEGQIDPLSPEAAGRGLWTALSMAGAGMPYAQHGALGTSGGKGIKAYHGSPYDFERFDISKIGTGEAGLSETLPVSDRQVGSYGPGLYFAENENVAKAYRGRAVGRSEDTGGRYRSIKISCGRRRYADRYVRSQSA